ncbi:MAG: hypothetical protein GQ574_06560 [Crocinitomix sp.]|nr:hypothetical protein [Crocinitomix sp.]
MKRKHGYLIVLLIIFISSCNTFNTGSFLSNRQGKNKVIERDFESTNDFEGENEIVETESNQEPVETYEAPTESVEVESEVENSIESNNGSINFEENWEETPLPFNDTHEPVTEIEEDHKVESNTVLQAIDDNSELDTAAKVALIIVLLILLAILIFVVVVVAFILDLF